MYSLIQSDMWGLSPRVRGNRHAGDDGTVQDGSIPACAGEPCYHMPRSARMRVYPRVCGGTRQVRQRPEAVRVYPRVCGGTAIGDDPPGMIGGSIPACAGEPLDGATSDRLGVYPRVCGGTAWTVPRRQPLEGLSPRVRGNPWRLRREAGCHGSIPACAGEPLEESTQANQGGGLSPRVRGNRAAGHRV